jgi:hypothetical protein
VGILQFAPHEARVVDERTSALNVTQSVIARVRSAA